MATIKKYNGSSWENATVRKYGIATETIQLGDTIYADGTAATVSLKGNTVQNGTPSPSNPVDVNGVGVRTENLFDGRLQQGFYAYSNGAYTYGTNYVCTYLIPCEAETTYTFNLSRHNGSKNYGFVFFDENQSRIGADYSSEQTITDEVTYTATSPQNSAYLAINIAYATGEGGIDINSIKNFMLNTGSTAKPYEPYGYKIPISSGETTTPVYLGEVQTTRRVKELVLTGDEDWKLWTMGASSTTERFYINIVGVGTIISICSHFQYAEDSSDTIHFRFGGTNRNELLFWIDKQDASTVADFKSYLQQQYAAGTPVCVWYVLTNEETGIVNKPLCKIGDYADTLSNATAIPTTEGANSITVDTTVQPSEFTATWTGWHNSSVEEWDGSDWQ